MKNSMHYPLYLAHGDKICTKDGKLLWTYRGKITRVITILGFKFKMREGIAIKNEKELKGIIFKKTGHLI